jgi:hypothetical protein
MWRELCKELCHENKAITLMTVESWEVAARPIYIRILDYILKYNACIGNMQMKLTNLI